MDDLVEVYVIGLEAFQLCFKPLPPSGHRFIFPQWILGGDINLVTAVFDRLTDVLLAVPSAVSISRVYVVNAEIHALP